MKINRKLYNEVLRFLSSNNRQLEDMSRYQALEHLKVIFKAFEENDYYTTVRAYDKWRRYYIELDKPVKPMTETFSFRCTPEEKEEIKLLLDGRNAKNVILELLRNE